MRRDKEGYIGLRGTPRYSRLLCICVRAHFTDNAKARTKYETKVAVFIKIQNIFVFFLLLKLANFILAVVFNLRISTVVLFCTYIKALCLKEDVKQKELKSLARSVREEILLLMKNVLKDQLMLVI